MKLDKRFLEGYCQALIDTNEGIDSDLDVTAHVYYIDLTDSYEVAINWVKAFDNYKEEEIRDFQEFKINDLKAFGFELANLLDKLAEVKFDGEYDSRQDKLQEIADRKEFAEEMKYEKSKGN